MRSEKEVNMCFAGSYTIQVEYRWIGRYKAWIGYLPFLDGLPIVRAILGFILVFFLPGFAWTLVFLEIANR